MQTSSLKNNTFYFNQIDAESERENADYSSWAANS